MKKFIFTILFTAYALMANAQTFTEVDFERLIMNHPLLKNFEPDTGYFKNTKYYPVPLDVLKNEIASMTEEMNSLEKNIKDKAVSTIDEDIDDEEAFWNNIADSDRRIKEIDHQLTDKRNLLIGGGLPGTEELLPLMEGLCNDVFSQIYEKDRIILNNLPKYYSEPPLLDFHDSLQNFFYRPENGILEAYLSQSALIGLMFPESNKAILFQKENDK